MNKYSSQKDNFVKKMQAAISKEYVYSCKEMIRFYL